MVGRMVKKVFSSKNLDVAEVLDALETRSMVRLRPVVRPAQKSAWDALTMALLSKRADLLVVIVDADGKRYERVRGTSTPARITQQLKLAGVEYVLRTNATTPKWAQD